MILQAGFVTLVDHHWPFKLGTAPSRRSRFCFWKMARKPRRKAEEEEPEEGGAGEEELESDAPAQDLYAVCGCTVALKLSGTRW